MKLALALALAACGSKSAPIPAVATLKGALRVSITVQAPGMPATDVETGVVNPLEDVTAQIAGIAAIRSESREGLGRIELAFDDGVDRDTAMRDVHARLESAVRLLPTTVAPPAVSDAWPVDGAVLRYTVQSTSLPLTQLTELAEHTIGQVFATVPGVVGVDTCGSPGGTSIEVDSVALAGAGISLPELSRALTSVISQVTPMAGDEPFDFSALRSTVIAVRSGTLVRLGDVAIVNSTDATQSCFALDEHGVRVIEGVVYAQRGADPKDVRDRALGALPSIKALLPSAADLRVMPTDKPSALLGIATDAADGSSLPSKSTRLEEAAHEAAAAGADHLVIARGDRALGTGVARDEIELRIWPRTVEAAVLARLQRVPGLLFAPSGAHVVAIRGPDLAVLHDQALVLAKRLTSVRDTIVLGPTDGGQELRTEAKIDRAKAADLNVAMSDVSATLAVLSGDQRIGTVARGNRSVDVTLRMHDPANDPSTLDHVFVRSAAGALVPMSAMAMFETVPVPRAIRHVNRQRTVGVRVVASGKALDDVNKLAAALELPAGYIVTVE